MTTRNVSICIFYDKESRNIIIQERDNHSKVGEKYGFWGGGMLNGESKEQALYRELREELGYKPKEIEYLYKHQIKITTEGIYKDWIVNIHVFVSPITKELRECKVNEGKSMIEMNIDKAIEQKDDFLEDTVDILKKVKREILSK
jgi:8-oxo-dGTP pyrophosphatase MutT (NUDIX family)